MRTALLTLILLGAVAGGVTWLSQRVGGGEAAAFRTAVIERGDLVVTVGATGTLEPEEVIDVGAQVVGRIEEFGLDPLGETDPRFKDKRITYRSEVEEGTVLARIDPAVYQAQFDQAQASYDRAVADLLQLEAKADQTKAEWARAQKLEKLTIQNPAPSAGAGLKTVGLQIQAISNSDFILAKANYEVARSNVAVGKAAVKQAKAVLDLAKTNLDYTVIKSPVKGTVIDRRVNIGQTVVASLNAPSLFLLAKDLRRMQVWASVNEADIGQLKAGGPVTFTVDAFPSDEFAGHVEQIRLNATMMQNVVTYTVVIAVDNSDLKLLPYLTADVKFEIQRREDVLRVPNPALRYTPRPDQVVPGASLVAAAGSRASRSKGASAATTPAAKRGVVWVREGALLSPREVTLGATDGSMTEVSGEGLTEGLEVVLGEARADVVAEAVNNPFAPKFPGGKSR